MALSNIVLLSQVAGYVVALILSLCVIVPMSLHQDEFRYCLGQVEIEVFMPMFIGDTACCSRMEFGRNPMGS